VIEKRAPINCSHATPAFATLFYLFVRATTRLSRTKMEASINLGSLIVAEHPSLGAAVKYRAISRSLYGMESEVYSVSK